MFNPKDKKNQHYVPVFWQKRFADANGTLYKLENNHIGVAGAKKQMSDDWIYTTFDFQWKPSNYLEEASSFFENQAASAFNNIDTPNTTGSIEEQILIRWFISFSACRHPDTMSSGHRLGKCFATHLLNVHSVSIEEFSSSLIDFGVSQTDARSIYTVCRDMPIEQLISEVIEIENMTPQDPNLPQQLSIDSETIERVFFHLCEHNITILDAPPGVSFILGDTPFPPNLSAGFCIPLSSKVALLWEPGEDIKLPEWTRRMATVDEVHMTNQLQFNQALKLIIGSSRELLEKYRS
jgi:hypothetical protein